MELKFSTKNAVDAVDALEKRMAGLETKLASFDTSGVTRLRTEFSKVQGIPKHAVTSIGELATALKSLNKATNLKDVSDGLKSFGTGGGLATAAQNITQLSHAMAAMKVPRGMAAFVKNVNDLATAAGTATPRVMALSRALGSTQAPGSLRGVATQIRQIGAAGGTAANGINRAGTELRLLGGISLGVGVWQTFSLLKQIGGQSIEAANEFVAFQSKMTAAGQSAQGVANSYDWLKTTTQNLAIPLDVGLQAFSKLSISMQEVGQTTEDTRRVFAGFSTGFRAMGLTADQTNRAFNAVSQMFTKGAVSMEELRQQLGEVFPAFGLLAKSMGITTMELAAMMAQGKVGSGVLLKLADDIKTKFAPAAEFMGKTGTAAVINFKSALTELSAVSGEALYRGLNEGLRGLVASMNTNAVTTFAGAIGSVLGNAMGILAQMAGTAAYAVGVAIGVIKGLWGAVTGLISSIPVVSQLFDVFGVAVGYAGTTLTTLGAVVGVTIIGMIALRTAVAVSTLVWGLLGTAITGALMALLRWVAIGTAALTALTFLGVGLKSIWDSFTQGGTVVENFKTNLQGVQAIVASATGAMGSFADSMLAGVTPVLNLKAATDAQVSSMAATGDAAAQAEAGLRGLEVSTGGLTEGLGALGSRAQNVEAGITGTGASAARAAQEFSSAETKALAAAQAWGDMKVGLGGAADAADDAASSVGGANSAASSGQSALDALAGSAYGAAGAYENLASSAASAASSISRVKVTGGGGGGGRQSRGALDDANSQYTTDFDFSGNSGFDFSGNSGFDFGSNRKGGSAGSPSGIQRASFSSFVGAPALRDGIANTNKLTPSLAGGGIPTILHGNEAVVPLPSGGAIPVQMSVPNTGSGNGGDGGVVRSLSLDMSKLLEAFTGYSQRALNYLQTMSGILTKNTSSAGGSFGGGGSGGLSTSSGAGGGAGFRTGSIGAGGGLLAGSVGGGSGGGGGDTASGDGQIGGLDYQLITQYQGLMSAVTSASAASSAAQASANTFRYGTGPVWVNPRDAAAIASASEQWRAAQEQLTTFRRAHPDFIKAYEKNFNPKNGGLDSITGSGVGAFATGSPNASRDMRGGGFNAILHPDEAVIPLPDGRSVPMKLPKAMTQALKGGSANNGSKQQITNFYITTPDAQSFRQSETQITERMRANLARANERTGPPARKFEDPTRRVAQVK